MSPSALCSHYTLSSSSSSSCLPLQLGDALPCSVLWPGKSLPVLWAGQSPGLG